MMSGGAGTSAISSGVSRFMDIAAALPDHLLLGAEAAHRLTGLPSASDIDNIVVFGMGTGRSAGLVLRAVGASIIPVPVLVESSYEVPACIGPRSLVFAFSGSGNTGEVNHAAANSVERGASLVAVTVGGWLADFAQSRGAHFLRIPPEIQPARATFGLLVGALLTAIEAIGFLPDAGKWIESAATQLRRRRDELRQTGSFTEILAGQLVGRHIICQGDTPIGATAAERWKAQLNQNARQAASLSEQPNASHNEAVAWDSRNDITMAHEAAVLLRHPFANYLANKVPVHAVRGEGDTPLAALMDLAMIGDFVSLHLGQLNGVDPGDVPFIAQTVKEGMVPPGGKPRG
jgi:glucose/mannose-6-phosphate isomerase